MSNRCAILIGAAAIAITAYSLTHKNKNDNTDKKAEKYRDLFIAKDIPNDEIIARPSFSAQLAPRFDPFRSGEYNKLNGYLPNIAMMASPQNPLGNGSLPINGDKVDYSAMGNSGEILRDDINCAEAKLKKYSSMAVGGPGGNGGGNGQGGSSREGFSMMNGNPSSPMTRSQLEYTDPKDLLPQPDMASVLTKDPTDPNVFNYDRTLFSKLKRRNLNNVDFIRGDIPIAMDKKGWFDVAANPGTDLAQGAMSVISPDLSEQTMLQDLIYTRYDHQYPAQQNVVSGDLSYRFN